MKAKKILQNKVAAKPLPIKHIALQSGALHQPKYETQDFITQVQHSLLCWNIFDELNWIIYLPIRNEPVGCSYRDFENLISNRRDNKDVEFFS